VSPELPRLLARTPGEPGSLARALREDRDGARELLPDGRWAPGPRAADPSSLPARGERGRLSASVLRASGPEARRRAEAALEGEGVFVTTGQQPVLFLGPLYVVYKALTAVAVADALTAAGTPAAPLFWVAGDDHDWDEVGRTRVLDTSNRLRELRVEPAAERVGRAVGPSPLPEAVEERLDELTQHLPESEFAPRYLDLLRDAWSPGRGFSEAFGSTLERLLPACDLVWLDAASPETRRTAAPLFERVLRDADEVTERLERGTGRVRAAGWSPQLETEPGALPLFLDTEGGRQRLYRSDGGFRVGRGGGRVGGDRVRAELEERPERFSPDAALRPVTASWLLPTGVTVLGPAETAYWAQLPPLFDWAETPFPRLRPRDGWTVLEGKIGKVLEKLDAEPDAFEDGGRSLAREIREEGRPAEVGRSLENARAAFGRSLAEVEEAVSSELPGIRSAVGAARHRAFEVLDELDAAVDDRVEERHEVVLGQIRKAARHLWPDGRPQERVLTPFYYLARYGRGFLELVERRARSRAGETSE